MCARRRETVFAVTKGLGLDFVVDFVDLAGI